MVCPVYFHLFLPGNTGLYICTCVLWRVGCADITESLCDLILVTGCIFVHRETRIKINIWFNLPVHVLFFTLPSFLWHNLTEEQCWRSAMHAPHHSSSKGKKENMQFSFYRDNPAKRHKTVCFGLLNLDRTCHSITVSHRNLCEGILTPSFDARWSSVVPRVWFVRDKTCGVSLPLSFLLFVFFFYRKTKPNENVTIAGVCDLLLRCRVCRLLNISHGPLVTQRL